MNSRERVEKTMNFQTPDRVPFNFWMDRRLLSAYEEKYGEFFRVRHYGGDVIESFLNLPFQAGRFELHDGSWWCVEPLIKDWSQLKDIVYPDPKAENVLDDVKRKIALNPDKAVFLNVPGPLGLCHGMRLMDEIYYDVYDYPECVDELYSKVMAAQTEALKDAVKLDIAGVYFQDDIASSSGPLMSMEMTEKFIFRYMEEGIDIAKKAGKKLIYHSDGNVTKFWQRLYEMGFDAINPMQPEFNDFKAFKRLYHGKMGVYGGMDNTKIISYGTVSEVKEHIYRVFEELGDGGGLIMSSHDITIDCPDENVEAMVSAIKECVY